MQKTAEGTGRKKRISLIVKVIKVLLILLAYSSIANAQINIINVPTAEVSEKGRLFFQEQATISNRTVQSGTIFTWGLEKNFQAGFSIQQLSFNTRPHSRDVIIDPEQPENTADLLVNAQQGINAGEWLTFGVGTQTGTNVARRSEDMRFLNFSYVNSQLTIPDTETFFLLGGYYGNHAFLGEGNNWGIMAGAEAEVIKDRFSLIGDYLSGTNALSSFHAGFTIHLPKSWSISLAGKMPAPGSGNSHGGVIQLTRK